jgi:hypothetical protein
MCVIAGLSATWCAGCEPYRVEYRTYPSFYTKAGLDMPDALRLDDGTVVVYREQDDESDVGISALSTSGEPSGRSIREEFPDGRVQLRNYLPEHVLANLFHCLRNEEYAIIYEQLLSNESKVRWEEEGNTPEDFMAFFRQHRQAIAKTVNRIILGLPREEVERKFAGNFAVCFRLRRHLADQFPYRQVEVLRDDDGWKLYGIH